jgi:NADH-quinone oxidoreductase subunit N
MLALLPEITLLVFALIVLGIDLTTKPSRRFSLGWVSAIGITIALVAALIWSRPEEGQNLILGGMLRHDWIGFSFKILILFAAAVSSLLSIGVSDVADRGEYFTLMLVATLGMNLMASAADLMMLFLAIETTSIPLYVLAGFLKRDEKST